jgi:hypothetical protein
MNAILLSAVVGEDRHLIIDLPPDAPIGHVEVEIRPAQIVSPKPVINPAREAARAKLLAAGALVTSFEVPEGTIRLTVEERMRIGTLPAGARSSDELIDEDRGRR